MRRRRPADRGGPAAALAPARGVLSMLVTLLTVLSLTLSSCSLVGDPPEVPQTPATSTDRPLRPIPSVEPDGFTDPPPGQGLPRYLGQRLDWKPCSSGLSCASVLVPLDYGTPDGTAITLSLAKRSASAPGRLGTLFINPGGPGGSGVDYVGYFDRKGLERYDIVGWDPRGVGRSTPVSCAGADLDELLSMDVSPDDAAEREALLQADREFGLECLERSGPLLQHVSTVEVARDLDVLRQLVGDERTSFFGASYGTQIGATYAELFPARVGRMVLDGAVNLTDDTSTGQAQGFERALVAFADWCAGRRCALGATRAEVLAAVAGWWTRLDSAPLPVGSRALTQQLAVTGVIFVLYASAEGYETLLQALSSGIDGQDGRLLLQLADQLNERSNRGRYGQINYSFPAVRCLDTRDKGVQGEIALATEAITKAPTVGPFLGADLVCPMWPVAPVPELAVDGAGAAPIVVIGTTGDPATPYEHAVSMARELKSGVLLTFRGVGHTGYNKSACVQRLVQAYLVDGRVPEDGSRC